MEIELEIRPTAPPSPPPSLGQAQHVAFCRRKRCCCACCELCSCLTITFVSMLCMIYTGVTSVNYRFNIASSAVKAVFNPFFALLLIISSLLHVSAYIVGLACPCVRSNMRKRKRKRKDNNNNKEMMVATNAADEECCSVNCYPRCGSRWRKSIIVIMIFNYFLVLIPVWSVTSTTGAWLSSGVVETTFGSPSVAQASRFARSVPYNFVDHIFLWAQPQCNPITSNFQYLTATYRFKNITESTPNPLADSLPFMNLEDMPMYSTPDLPYLSLDLYHPSSVGIISSVPAPVIFHVHGGAFVALGKSVTSMPVASYQRQGYAVISIDYRLAPYGWNGWDIQKDLVEAFLWVRANAAMMNVDGNRMIMAGESAGGFASSYLCYLFGATKDTWTPHHTENLEAIGLLDSTELFQKIAQERPIKGCLNLYAAVNIVSYLDDTVQDWFMLKERVPDLVRVMLRKNRTRAAVPISEDSDWKQLLSLYGPSLSLPNFVTSTAPPTLSIHGQLDVVVPNDMTLKLHEALNKANVSNAVSLMGGRGHNFDISEYSVGGQSVWYAFERFLAAVAPIDEQ
jgi:acetyl esterase/lipase